MKYSGARIIAICIGVFALLQAGILDGRSATTHWQHIGELLREYPSVQIRPDVPYVNDGALVTSACMSSGLDLCLHVLRNDLGMDAARVAVQELAAAPHRDGNHAAVKAGVRPR